VGSFESKDNRINLPYKIVESNLTLLKSHLNLILLLMNYGMTNNLMSIVLII